MKKIVAVFLVLLGIIGGQSVYAESITVQDSRGEVTLADTPQKIVVLGYSEYDTLRTLGLEALVVGVPKSNTPAYIGQLPDSIVDIGSLKEPNLEAIAELQPDLIVANGRTAELATELEKIAPVFVLSVDTKDYWTSFSAQNIALATLVGKKAEAEKEIAALETRVEEIKTQNKDSQATNLMLMLNEGNISAFSANSRFALIFQVLGLKPVDTEIEDSRHGQEMSYEGILSLNPDRIFYMDRGAAIGGDTSANEGFVTNPLIAQTKASQNQAIYALSSDLWYLGGGGLESVHLQIEEIAKAIMQ